ncbi:metal-dependent hydrolase [Halomarina oriensis]|uniref:Metal-dependent hydrolase n=1 Tax=Halomarina oriensis TaxID=671145 RepID=A0A6B0GX42_9EURY|nr:metal-dependent hydrolase [Halomarina oriensis]
MWPWGHLGFGYLLYSLSRRATGRGPPTDAAALALAFGTQFPDVVDKPLAWWLTVLPSGRSLAHSALFGTLVVALVWWVLASREHSEAGSAFALGYASHLLGDSLVDLSAGAFGRLTFLLWPVLPAVEYDDEGLGPLVGEFALTPWVLFGLLVGVLTAVLWAVDGFPGVAGVTRWYRRVRSTVG